MLGWAGAAGMTFPQASPPPSFGRPREASARSHTHRSCRSLRARSPAGACGRLRDSPARIPQVLLIEIWACTELDIRVTVSDCDLMIILC